MLSVLLAILAASAPSTGSVSAAREIKAANERDAKVVCKASEETGSLIGRRKICLTVQQWRSLARGAQAYGEGMQEQGAICPACQAGGAAPPG